MVPTAILFVFGPSPCKTPETVILTDICARTASTRFHKLYMCFLMTKGRMTNTETVAGCGDCFFDSPHARRQRGSGVSTWWYPVFVSPTQRVATRSGWKIATRCKSHVGRKANMQRETRAHRGGAHGTTPFATKLMSAETSQRPWGHAGPHAAVESSSRLRWGRPCLPRLMALVRPTLLKIAWVRALYNHECK